MNRRQALKTGVALAALPALPAIGAVDDSQLLADLVKLGPVNGGTFYLENPVVIDTGIIEIHHCHIYVKLSNPIFDLSGGDATAGSMTYCTIHNYV